MDTGPELNRICLITPGWSGSRLAGGINLEGYYVRLNYVFDSDYGVSSDGGI